MLKMLPPAKTKVWVHCHICVFFTYDDKILKEHIDEEHSKTSWRCTLCIFTTNCPTKLGFHRNEIHYSYFTCRSWTDLDCDYEGKSKQDRTRHILARHEGELAGKTKIKVKFRAHDIEIEDIELGGRFPSEEIEEQVKRSIENKNWVCEIEMLTSKCDRCKDCMMTDLNEIDILTRNPSVIGSDDENKDGENKDSENENKATSCLGFFLFVRFPSAWIWSECGGSSNWH